MFLYKRDRGNGYVHRNNAEKMLGRYLLEGEVVHHIDSDPTNNSLNNLMVFKTNRDHMLYHTLLNKGITPDVKEDNGAYYVEYVNLLTCEQCGKTFEPKEASVKFCSHKCSTTKSRRVNRPSAIELHKLLWSKPTTHIAKDFGVSDKAVEKWTKFYGIPKPYRGFWAQVLAGTLNGISCPLP